MTKQHIEVITSVERRRRWSQEDKERLVAACLEPGVSVSEVARAAGCHVSQLFRWRKQLCTISDGRASTDRATPAPSPAVQFVPVTISDAVSLPSPAQPTKPAPPQRARRKPSVVMIELGRGKRVRFDSDIDTEALGRILDLLERR
ncbi:MULTISPECIES: IS66-like element accessory protein TnpA [Alphaproteobacteria]|jgi:transposase|uniref:IS66-like element accessory protein TnpA n=1 Tax=Alphaproteobacteria TaxID=28211 RepID=UPI001AD9ECC1|nr:MULTISPECIES: transposase [Alphaproteobacteria]MBO9463583.1 transposase [Labrenzia sp. R5_0]MCH2396497.1 transposase [Oceanibaculum sp.]